MITVCRQIYLNEMRIIQGINYKICLGGGEITSLLKSEALTK